MPIRLFSNVMPVGAPLESRRISKSRTAVAAADPLRRRLDHHELAGLCERGDFRGFKRDDAVVV